MTFDIDLDMLFQRALLWIILLPLCGAIINGIVGRSASKQLVGAVAVGSVGLSFALAVGSFIHLIVLKGGPHGDSARIVHEAWQWFAISVDGADVPIRVAFVLDSLSGVMALVVTGVGLLIHVYSLEYMDDDPGYARFFTYLNLFTASMLILILGSSMPVMFVGWEGVGLCSYLLIGFWFKTPEYAAAGKKAFIVNRIGDFGVLVGMFILVNATHSFEFAEINANANSLSGPFILGHAALGTLATAAVLFLFLGCTGKSAQIPLFIWLPDAMAGPTPVSALIHAATMVTSGIYLACRLSDVFIMSPTAMAVIAVVGALTALLAASIALVQNQMKRILAYSTVSQLGFMFAAVGSGAFAAGIFHVYTHAFFKACLFLGAGAVMHAVHAHGDADIRRLGGLGKILPGVRTTFLLSTMAIAGVPLFSGWFSKDEILLGALSSADYFNAAFGPGNLGTFIAWGVFGALVAAAIMTAFYMFRLYFVTFSGSTYRSASGTVQAEGEEAPGHGYDAHPHAPGQAIATVLWVLGLGAVIVGFVNLGPLEHLAHADVFYGNAWGDWLAPAVATVDGHGNSLIAMAGGLLAFLTGFGAAYVFYRQNKRVPGWKDASGLARVLMNKWYVDELYGMLIVRPIHGLARFAASLDKYMVDMVLTKATAFGAMVTGWVLTRAQNGVVYTYAAFMVLGVAVLSWWFTFPHPSIEGTVTSSSVEWTAGRGLGYEYRWDINSDDEFECDWGEGCGHQLTHTYDAHDYSHVTVHVTGPHGSVTLELHGRDPVELPLEVLDEGWHQEGIAEPAAPALRVSARGAEILRNDATLLHVDGQAQEGTHAELVVGQEATVGGATLQLEGPRLAVIVTMAGSGRETAFELDVHGHPTILTSNAIGPAWFEFHGSPATETEPELSARDDLLPSVSIGGAGVVLRSNQARVRVRGSQPETEDVVLSPGDVAQIGDSLLTVAAVVDATVEVRNAFGHTASQSEEIVIRPAAGSSEHAALSRSHRPAGSAGGAR